MKRNIPRVIIENRWFFLLAVAGVLLRLAVVVVPGNSLQTPWSAGNDTSGYVLLAQNLVSGAGYSYAHEPSAFRAPGYPFLLAGLIKVFGLGFASAVRWLQLLAGLGISYCCFRAARSMFNEETGKLAFLASLVCPTLVFFTSEILTETLAALFVAIFCWLLAEDAAAPRGAYLMAMGIAIGCGALFRANVASLAIAGLVAGWLVRRTARARLQVMAIPLFALLPLAPWLIRNRVTFGGSVLFSTQGGLNALVSIVDPQGRTQPGDSERIRALLGFVPPQDIETNSSTRLALGSEVEINRQAWIKARQGWSQMRWHIVSWAARKWACFWLSTEQVFSTTSLPPWKRAMRLSGAAFYWAFLALAASGLWSLKNQHETQARVIVAYAILVTLLHTPFVMNTRIRAPLLDPLLAVLAAAGWMAVFAGYRASAKVAGKLAVLQTQAGS